MLQRCRLATSLNIPLQNGGGLAIIVFIASRWAQTISRGDGPKCCPQNRQSRKGRPQLPTHPFCCLFFTMRRITSKELHEQTEAVLDKVKRGERFSVSRGGTTAAILIPACDQGDLALEEIMADVRKARAEVTSFSPNPVLNERRKRNCPACKL